MVLRVSMRVVCWGDVARKTITQMFQVPSSIQKYDIGVSAVEEHRIQRRTDKWRLNSQDGALMTSLMGFGEWCGSN